MPLTRSQVYRRRRIAVFSSIGVVLGTLVYLPMTLLAPLSPATAVVQPYSVQPSVPPQLTVPSYGASLLVADGYGTLAQGGSDAPLPMASIAKVVTSLVVLEAKPLNVGETGPTVMTTAQDVATYEGYLRVNGSVEPVSAGLTFSQYELLQLVLIESANNYTETLANWAFGSQAAYLEAAHGWVSAQGFASMTLVDSTGISLENTATAADLVALSRLAMQHPVIAEIVATPAVRMHDVGLLENSNPVLGDLGVTGLKTGTLRAFGYNLLFSATHQVGETSIALYGVVLGAPSGEHLEWDVLALLESATAGFQELSLVEEGTVLAEYQTAWGDTGRLVTDRSQSVVVWGDTPVSVLVSGESVTTGFEGDEVGSATFVVGDRSFELPLVLAEEVADPGVWWRLTNPVALF